MSADGPPYSADHPAVRRLLAQREAQGLPATPSAATIARVEAVLRAHVKGKHT